MKDLDRLPALDVLKADILKSLQSALDNFNDLMATLRKENKKWR